MAIETRRALCMTREASRIYGCTMGRIRQLAREGVLWCEKVGERALVFDADQVRRLAKERSKLRARGKIRGVAPQGFSPDVRNDTRRAKR